MRIQRTPTLNYNLWSTVCVVSWRCRKRRGDIDLAVWFIFRLMVDSRYDYCALVRIFRKPSIKTNNNLKLFYLNLIATCCTVVIAVNSRYISFLNNQSFMLNFSELSGVAEPRRSYLRIYIYIYIYNTNKSFHY